MDVPQFFIFADTLHKPYTLNRGTPGIQDFVHILADPQLPSTTGPLQTVIAGARSIAIARTITFSPLWGNTHHHHHQSDSSNCMTFIAAIYYQV